MIGTVLAGAFGALLTLLAALVALPKIRGEARRANAQADDSIANRLYREIERIDKELRDVRAELAHVKSAAEDEKQSLEKENRRLRFEVSSLRTRISQLEEIIKTKTTPEDMRAQLAEIDRKTKRS